MRYRVKYDIHTSRWDAFGKYLDVQASSPEHASALVERAIYADKDAILAARHDDAGEGFVVTILSAYRAAQEQP